LEVDLVAARRVAAVSTAPGDSQAPRRLGGQHGHREGAREVVEVPRYGLADLEPPRGASGGEVLRKLSWVGDALVNLFARPGNAPRDGEPQVSQRALVLG